MTVATFFLSTGRCGTQWIARNLRRVVPAGTTVRHEPIYLDYWPRQLLGLGDPKRLPAPEKLLEHLDYIERSLQDGPYIECGWPSYGAVPYLVQRFAGRIRIVHLVRHPASTAYSLTTHNWYSFPPRFKNIAERGELTPFDPGIRLPAWRQHWSALSPFEKCLYFWAEIHSLGLELEQACDAPWLRLRYEDVFLGGEGLAQLAGFLGLGNPAPLQGQLEQREDRVSYQASEAWDPGRVARHRDVVSLAEGFGYDALATPEGDLRRRYALPERRQSGANPGAATGVGRNAPCPCGSGLRFKHCHGRTAA